MCRQLIAPRRLRLLNEISDRGLSFYFSNTSEKASGNGIKARVGEGGLTTQRASTGRVFSLSSTTHVFLLFFSCTSTTTSSSPNLPYTRELVSLPPRVA